MSFSLRITRLSQQQFGGAGGSAAVYSILRLQQQKQKQWQLLYTLRLYSTTGNEPRTTPTSTYGPQQPSPQLPSSETKQNVRIPRVMRGGKLMYDPKMQWDVKPEQKGAAPAKQQQQLHKKSTDEDKSVEKKTEEQKATDAQQKDKKKPQDWQGYVFRRYFDYVKNYDTVLEKNFPKAFSVYRVFFDGVSAFFTDMKRYLQVARIVTYSPLGMRALIRKDLELYRRMPHDMYKVAPALIGCSLPFVGYAFFPLVFMFPRQFLTSHFWTMQQRIEFEEYYLKQRLCCNKAAFRELQSKLKSLRAHPQHEQLECILGQLGSGFHPSVDALLEVKDIFATGPLSFPNLSRKQVNTLIKLNDVNVHWFKRFRLREHAFLIHLMDLAIMREGHPHNMDIDSLRYSCSLRGLNPTNLTKEEMVEWLRNWIKVSTSIQEEHISLFLHLPILLGYNHPNNWQLIYEKHKKTKCPQEQN